MPYQKRGCRRSPETLFVHKGVRIEERDPIPSIKSRAPKPEAQSPKPETCSQVAINAINAIIDSMASITIRKLPENTKRRLRIRAAKNGRSM